MFYNFLAATGAEGSKGSSMSMIIMLVAMFGLMYFMMIRPQKKKQKEDQMMRDNIQPGDEITTIGGICGRVVSVKEDSYVIETGADRNKMKITKWAVQMNNTANEKAAAEREAAKKAAEEAKAAKKAAKAKKDEE
ncbi:MAG: preprotein translocase subunit YajC [Ruminococcaceae bacterium]|mgnify:CR=1 FL=1|nr:preprotein translocase subunit YajC [Oscillospiraceae bacterium]